MDAILVDIHAEATSEKMAMGHWLDGRVSLVAGTHSHVPTADAQVLEKGTAYITDMGMCGDYDSVIGMKKASAIERFVKKIPGGRLEPAEGEATVCGVYLETDDGTGLAVAVSPLRAGGRLAERWPAIEHEDMTGRGSARTRAPRFHGPRHRCVSALAPVLKLLSPPPGQLLSSDRAGPKAGRVRGLVGDLVVGPWPCRAMVYETIALSLAGFYYPTT